MNSEHLVSTYGEWLPFSSKVGLLFLGAAVGWLAEWLRNRTKLIHEVAERYIADRRASHDQDSPGNRLGAMQRSGVGLLKNDRQIGQFFRIVVGRGCTHPFFESDIGKYFRKNGLSEFLNGNSARGTALNEDLALYEALVQAYAEQDQKKCYREALRIPTKLFIIALT